MKTIRFALAAGLILLFASCDTRQYHMPEIQTDEILKELDATDIMSACYADDQTIYISAYNKKSQRIDGHEEILDQECILLQIDLSENKREVLFRDKYIMEHVREMSATKLDNTDIIFTGFMLFFINGHEISDFIFLDGVQLQEAAYHFATNRLAIASKQFNRLDLIDQSISPEPVLIYQGIETQKPVDPRISPDGSKILVKIVKGNHLIFDKIFCFDSKDGEQLLSIDNIERIGDDISCAWIDDEHFVVRQSIEEKNGEFPSGYASHITCYNLEGEIVSQFLMEGLVETAKVIEKNDWQLFSRVRTGYDENNRPTHMLALIDLKNKSAESIYRPQRIIHSQDIAPNGQKFVCVQADKIVEMNIDAFEHTQVRTINTPTTIGRSAEQSA